LKQGFALTSGSVTHEFYFFDNRARALLPHNLSRNKDDYPLEMLKDEENGFLIPPPSSVTRGNSLFNK
jgi:hypothetical protein